MNRINHRKYRLRDLLFGPRKCPTSCPTCVPTYNRPKLVPPPSGPTYNLPKSVSLDIQIRIKIDSYSIKITLHVSLYRHGFVWMILLGMPKVIGKVKAVSNSSNCTSKNESWQLNLSMPKKNEKIWKHSLPISFSSVSPISRYTVWTGMLNTVCLLTNKIFHHFLHMYRVLRCLYISLNLKSLHTSLGKLQVFYSSWTWRMILF